MYKAIFDFTGTDSVQLRDRLLNIPDTGKIETADKGLVASLKAAGYGPISESGEEVVEPIDASVARVMPSEYEEELNVASETAESPVSKMETATDIRNTKKSKDEPPAA